MVGLYLVKIRIVEFDNILSIENPHIVVVDPVHEKVNGIIPDIAMIRPEKGGVVGNDLEWGLVHSCLCSVEDCFEIVPVYRILHHHAIPYLEKAGKGIISRINRNGITVSEKPDDTVVGKRNGDGGVTGSPSAAGSPEILGEGGIEIGEVLGAC